MAVNERTYGFRKDDAEALINVIGNKQRTFRQGLVRGQAGTVKVFLTPSGGIAARSGATLGSASCTLISVAGGTRATTTNTFTVYNDFTSSVGGSTDIVASKIDGEWIVIAEDCP